MLTQENFQCFILNKCWQPHTLTHSHMFPPVQCSTVYLFVSYMKRYMYNERVNIRVHEVQRKNETKQNKAKGNIDTAAKQIVPLVES